MLTKCVLSRAFEFRFEVEKYAILDVSYTLKYYFVRQRITTFKDILISYQLGQMRIIYIYIYINIHICTCKIFLFCRHGSMPNGGCTKGYYQPVLSLP